MGAISVGAYARHLVDYPEPRRCQTPAFLYKPGHSVVLQVSGKDHLLPDRARVLASLGFDDIELRSVKWVKGKTLATHPKTRAVIPHPDAGSFRL
jgi:hypothetical protein